VEPTVLATLRASGFPPAYAATLVALLVLGGYWDARHRRLPNILSLAVLLVGVAAQALTHGAAAVGVGLVCSGIVMLSLWTFWARGGIGGGDVKFAAAAAAWLTFERLLVYALAAALAGGLVAFATYAASAPETRERIRANLLGSFLFRSLPTVEADRPGRVSVPYGIGIAAGLVAALWLEVWP